MRILHAVAKLNKLDKFNLDGLSNLGRIRARQLRNKCRGGLDHLLGSRLREQWIALYIASLAVLLSIATMGGSEAVTNASRANLNAVNLWAWYQAKKARHKQHDLAIKRLELDLLTPNLTDAQRVMMRSQIAAFTNEAAVLVSEPEKNEGMQQLQIRAQQRTLLRDRAITQTRYFDYATSFLQIAIVFASIAIIVSGSLTLILSAVLAVASILCIVNANLLVVAFHPLALVAVLFASVFFLVDREHLTFGSIVSGRRVLKRRPVRSRQ